MHLPSRCLPSATIYQPAVRIPTLAETAWHPLPWQITVRFTLWPLMEPSTNIWGQNKMSMNAVAGGVEMSRRWHCSYGLICVCLFEIFGKCFRTTAPSLPASLLRSALFGFGQTCIVFLYGRQPCQSRWPDR
jgi:hypothetical protein